MTSSDEIELTEAWVNLDYSANMNRVAPDLNAASPGRPYFVGAEGAIPGQWVRIVCRMSDGAVFWCVADLVAVLDGAIRVTAMLYEAGDPAPRWFLDRRWGGRLELGADGNWYVVELEQLDDEKSELRRRAPRMGAPKRGGSVRRSCDAK